MENTDYPSIENSNIYSNTTSLSLHQDFINLLAMYIYILNLLPKSDSHLAIVKESMTCSIKVIST